mmetsp:Transcript_18814/g.38217  ORF Transcript_18814/g.38217 Transcript_18814/m.38217 type:complete len:202 (-) Transcript_18814:179-784(-)
MQVLHSFAAFHDTRQHIALPVKLSFSRSDLVRDPLPMVSVPLWEHETMAFALLSNSSMVSGPCLLCPSPLLLPSEGLQSPRLPCVLGPCSASHAAFSSCAMFQSLSALSRSTAALSHDLSATRLHRLLHLAVVAAAHSKHPLAHRLLAPRVCLLELCARKLPFVGRRLPLLVRASPLRLLVGACDFALGTRHRENAENIRL